MTNMKPINTQATSKTVLIIDEALDKLKLLFDYLKGFGFRVLVATDGENALLQAENIQPDIILLEVMISDIDGFQICQRLKTNKHTKHIPIIFTTERDHPVDKVRGLQCGAEAYLTKPLQCEEILAYITTRLNAKNVQNKLYLRNLHLRTAQEKLEQQLVTQTLALEQEVDNRKSLEDQIQTYIAELDTKNEALLQLDQMKNEFFDHTSHDLRTPLNGIIGIAESMIDGATGSLTPEQMHNLMMIIFSGRQLNTIINDTMDAFKLKYQGLNLDLKAVDIYSITEVVMTMFQPLLGQKSLRLINNLERDLPAINADESRIQQILYNLIGNAIKFTEVGSVIVAGELQQDMLVVRITDTGIGIPPNRLNRIFQTKDVEEGFTIRKQGQTGLGLFITQQLIELHGGTITVDSILDQGTTFTITLPLHKWPVNASMLNQAIDALTIDNSRSNQGKQVHLDPVLLPSGQNGLHTNETTILVVDDELINVQILTNYLSMQNYKIAQAFDGYEALEAIEEVKPDLVLLDLMMPKMSGYDVCEKIRERYPPHQLPIILLTTKTQVADLVAGFEIGANDYLTKPFDKNELLARVKTHLRLAKINAAYGRFVPHEILRFLEKESINEVQLGDQVQQEMTILFSDIRSFTTLSESMTPHETFSFLNAYLGRVSPIIRQHRGFIDKYIGDAIMALFPTKVDDAVQSAIALQQKVTDYNNFSKTQNKRPIKVGIGLHTGMLMLGTIGETERMEGTVIADAVNVASRLEGLTKLYGASIIISEHSLLQLEGRQQYHTRFLGRVKVKGKKERIPIFEIFDGDAPKIIDLKLETLSQFELGLECFFKQNFIKANEQFSHVLKINPQDQAADYYLTRAKQILENRSPSSQEIPYNQAKDSIRPHPLLLK